MSILTAVSMRARTKTDKSEEPTCRKASECGTWLPSSRDLNEAGHRSCSEPWRKEQKGLAKRHTSGSVTRGTVGKVVVRLGVAITQHS